MAFARLALVAALGLSLPGTGWAAAEPDVVYVSAGATEILTHTRLLSNDATSGEVSVTIYQGPAIGSLQAGADHVEYSAFGLEQGQDSFFYRLEDSSGTSVAEVRVVIIPAVLPLAGRWPVEKAHPGLECGPGDGSELGFFFTEEERFELCDFTGKGLRHCASWLVPDYLGGSATSSPGSLRLPLIADWDDDGWDEPGLFDPSSSELETFEYGAPCRGGMCLESTGIVHTGLARSEYPLSAPGSAGTMLSGYDWLADRLTSGAGAGMVIPGSTPASWPLLGDWLGSGQLLLGEWDPEMRYFQYLGDPAGQTIGTVFPTTTGGIPTTGIGFAGRWSRCGTESYFGLLQTGLSVMGLFPMLFPGGHSRPPVHVKVPVDPPD